MEPNIDPIIQKNIERWNLEQTKKREKKARTQAHAIELLRKELNREPRAHEVRSKIAFLLAERRAKWLLKECRATVGELVAAHNAKQGKK